MVVLLPGLHTLDPALILEQLLKIPPLSGEKSHNAGGMEGYPDLFCWNPNIFVT
jgi:hypothetical protein